MGEIYTVRSERLTVDLICWWYYGRTSEVTEKVLDANPNLASYGPLLPVGIKLTLPEIAVQATNPTVRLWD